MPLRKTRIVTALLTASLAGAAFAPAAANAGILSNLFKPKPKPAATQPAPAPAPAPTPAPAPAAPSTSGSSSSAGAPAAEPTAAASPVAPAAAPTGCTPLPTSKAFQKVDGDTADYSLAPGGDFEGSGTSGWTLQYGARLQTGNETLGVQSGKKSLRMPLNSVATSPKFCVDETHPHFRFAYKVDMAVLSGFIAYVVWRDSSNRITNIELVSSKVLNLMPTKWQATPNNPLATLLPLNDQTKSATVQLKIVALNPTDLVKDFSDAIIGENALTQLVTGLGGAASGLVAAITSTITPFNIGVSVDSVMVDPYRRG